MRIALIEVALVSFLLMSTAAQTQQPGSEIEPQNPRLTITARTVVVDVVVTDHSGRSIPDLTRDDFRVFENGVPQKVVFFEAHLTAAPTGAGTPIPLPPNTFSNAPESGPRGTANVLLIDALNTNGADRVSIRRQVLEYLNSLSNDAPIAVLELGDQLRVVQGFSSDYAQLHAAVARLLNGPTQPLTQALPGSDLQTSPLDSLQSIVSNGPGAAQSAETMSALQDFASHAYDVHQNQQVLTTLEALQEIGRYLSPIPGRKNLLWFSGSFPLCIPGMTYSSNEDCPYNDLVEEAVNTLAASRVSLYPIDAELVSVPNSEIGTKTQEDPTKNRPSDKPDDLSKQEFREINAESMAEATGGKAFHGNDVRKEIAEAIDHGSRYYAIAYTPAVDNEENRARKIEIRLSSGKYDISYRRTYFVEDSKQLKTGTRKPPSDPLRPLMMHGMPNFSQVQYRLQVESGSLATFDSHVAGDNLSVQRPVKRYSVRFSVSPGSINLQTDQDGVQRANVEVGLIARSESENALNWMVRDIGLAVRPEQLEQARRSGIAFHLDFDIPDAAVYLSSGVYDSSTNSAGTLEIPTASIRDQPKVTTSKTSNTPLPAQEPVATQRESFDRLTVQQLEQLVNRLHDKSDKEVARRIAACKLTERLSTVRLESLQESLPGEQSRSSLLVVADASAFLAYPRGDSAPASDPDLPAQKAILSSAVDFVVATTKRMPDFLAQEQTLRFQDTKFGVSENDPVVVTPNLYHMVDSKAVTVQYRDGREDRVDASGAHNHEEAGPSIGLTTWGVFGPLLQTVMRDVLKGKIGWSHWEQSASGSIAVFRYAVPKEEATYRLNWCCVAAELGTFRELQMVAGYHGEIAINPGSGAVMRVVVISDLDASQPVSAANIFVEYGPVEIGGRPYLCPTRSATMLVAKSPVQHGKYTQNGMSISAVVSVDNLNVTSISDSRFENYHVFRSEMKIVEH